MRRRLLWGTRNHHERDASQDMDILCDEEVGREHRKLSGPFGGGLPLHRSGRAGWREDQVHSHSAVVGVVVMKTVVVTGCLGFIGSHFARAALEKGWRVLGIDKGTYAADLDHAKEFIKHKNFTLWQLDIAEIDHLPDVDVVVNFAAETHVDNSIVDSKRFLKSNIVGVQNLLELIRAKRNYEMPLFIQISTDEVYGDIEEGKHTDLDRLHPSNPYSASKASADMLVMGWHRTYRVPYNIIRPTNNYGVGQYPEKLIPKAVRYLLDGKKVPLHGDGEYRRTWLHVSDTVAAIMAVLEKGERNKVYNVSGNSETSNREVVQAIANFFFGKNTDLKDHVQMNYIRQGEDIRYAVDDSALRGLGWVPRKDFQEGLREIVSVGLTN